MTDETVAPALIIGVGSLVRGDDGIGHAVAERLEEFRLPGVSVVTVTQLVPELAEPIGGARMVVFVDADIGVASPALRRVGAGGPGPASHHSSPESLCRLVELVSGHCPPSYVLGMPASSFEVGDRPGPDCLVHVDAAVRLISDLVGTEVDFSLPRGPDSG